MLKRAWCALRVVKMMRPDLVPPTNRPLCNRWSPSQPLALFCAPLLVLFFQFEIECFRAGLFFF